MQAISLPAQKYRGICWPHVPKTLTIGNYRSVIILAFQTCSRVKRVPPRLSYAHDYLNGFVFRYILLIPENAEPAAGYIDRRGGGRDT